MNGLTLGLTRRELLHRACIAAATLLALFAVLYVAFESAQARIPQHRAALERLVRAQTGLDLRFSSLALQWGWAGPEVAFGRIALESPGSRDFSLRAARLIVAFDAWRSIQTGHVELGSIRLIAPDIDLVQAEEGAVGRTGRERATGSVTPSPARAMAVLRRWSGGRIDLEGGTLRVAGPDTRALSIQLRSAHLTRSGSRWVGQTDLLLPARLGRTLRFSMDLRGDAPDGPDVSGTVRFDGRGLALPAWRAMLQSRLPQAARLLPESGVGTFRGLVNLHAGRIADGEGSLAARELAFPDAELGELRGHWQLRRQRSTWRLALAQLHLGSDSTPPSRGSLIIDEVTRRAHGTIDALDASQAVRLLRLDPGPDANNVDRGRLLAIAFDWNVPDPDSRTLNLTTNWQPPGSTNEPQPVAVHARLSWHAGAGGWDLHAEQIALTRKDAHLEMSGTLAPWQARAPRPFTVAGRVLHSDPAVLRELLGSDAALWLAPFDGAMHGDEISQAEFYLSGDATHRAAVDWRASLTNARLGGLEMESLAAAGLHAPDTPSLAPRELRVRARGEVPALRAWLTAQAPRIPGVLEASLVPPMSGEAALDFDLHGAPGRGPRVLLTLEDARLSLGPQFPPVESLAGTVRIEDGRFRRSSLKGLWLGGPLQLRLSSRGTQALAQVDGELEAAQAAQALGLRAGLLNGRAVWRGEWQWTRAEQTGDGTSSTGTATGAAVRVRPAGVWRGSAQSQLFGVASALPPPFDKETEKALPLRLDVEGSEEGGTVRIAATGRLQAVLAMIPGTSAEGGTWRVERAGLALGEGSAALPEQPVVAFSGAIPEGELTRLMAGWRELIASSDAPPLEGTLLVRNLTAAGFRYSDVQIDAQQTNSGLQLVFDSADLAGTVSIPAIRDDHAAGLVHLSRLRLAGTQDRFSLSELRALLGRRADLSIDRVSLESRDVGRLTAQLRNDDDALAVDRLELTSPLHEVRGEIRCADDGPCAGDLALETSDVAATLATFGYRDDVSAGHGRLETSLTWNWGDMRATLNGHASLALADGTVRPAAPELTSFPLFVVPALLARTDAGDMAFRRLAGDFDLRSGSAFTTNLHMDGDAEVFVRGRTGLVARDYDHAAWVLRGTDRLPAAIRRFGAAPAVASLWLGLREFFAADDAGKLLHVGGSWDAPVVTGGTEAPQNPIDPPTIEGAP